MKKGLLILAVLFLTACNEQYVLVKPNEVNIKGLDVSPVGTWNQAQNVSVDGVTAWTVDGPSLNELLFFPPIKNGKPMVDEDEYPSYDTTMLPNEVMEFVEISVSKTYSATISERGHLKPVTTKAAPAFQFSFDFVAEDDLTRSMLVTAIQRDEQLFLIMFSGAKLYYFDKELDNVETMMKNVELI